MVEILLRGLHDEGILDNLLFASIALDNGSDWVRVDNDLIAFFGQLYQTFHGAVGRTPFSIIHVISAGVCRISILPSLSLGAKTHNKHDSLLHLLICIVSSCEHTLVNYAYQLRP